MFCYNLLVTTAECHQVALTDVLRCFQVQLLMLLVMRMTIVFM